MSGTVWRVMGLSLIAATCAIGTVISQTNDRVPGEPVPGASVKVGRKPPKGGTIVAEGTTDAHGQCRFTDLQPGAYIVRIEVAGTKYKVDADDSGQAITIAAPSGTGDTTSRIATKPVVVTKDLGEVFVTIEIQGNSLTSNLNLSKSNVDRASSR
jgi:uncharacterized surface anchored protein